jgi:excinuclease UvrABC nuclease subunit
MNDGLAHVVQTLPDAPGVYKFFNADSILIYVERQKTLRSEFPVISTRALA